MDRKNERPTVSDAVTVATAAGGLPFVVLLVLGMSGEGMDFLQIYLAFGLPVTAILVGVAVLPGWVLWAGFTAFLQKVGCSTKWAYVMGVCLATATVQMVLLSAAGWSSPTAPRGGLALIALLSATGAIVAAFMLSPGSAKGTGQP